MVLLALLSGRGNDAVGRRSVFKGWVGKRSNTSGKGGAACAKKNRRCENQGNDKNNTTRHVKRKSESEGRHDLTDGAS